jgi:hypothetical protein
MNADALLDEPIHHGAQAPCVVALAYTEGGAPADSATAVKVLPIRSANAAARNVGPWRHA